MIIIIINFNNFTNNNFSVEMQDLVTNDAAKSMFIYYSERVELPETLQDYPLDLQKWMSGFREGSLNKMNKHPNLLIDTNCQLARQPEIPNLFSTIPWCSPYAPRMAIYPRYMNPFMYKVLNAVTENTLAQVGSLFQSIS